MKQTWRWFGPADTIALSDLHMVGVEGIVSALHDFPPGTVWTPEAISTRKTIIEQAGLSWDVVESLPVSEAIKTQGPDCAAHLETYKTSMRALAAAGIETICYNFMPILDWTRTDLRRAQPHGGTAMYFDLVDFAVFDLHLLARPGAASDYPEAVHDAAANRLAQMDDAAKADLANNIVCGLPGANDNWTLDDVRAHLSTYDNIDAPRLRSNLIDFLSEVAPLAQELGMRLCCHPDDPPFPLLGLPRVMSSLDDYAQVLNAVELSASGATLCTGSLGVLESFDAPEFVRRLGDRIHFVHLRNTSRLASPDPTRPHFFEAPHLGGDTNMPATIAALLGEEARRKKAGRSDWQIPMRPDHGQELLSDRGGQSQPGYPLLGRMRGLAELRGVMVALTSQETL
ncbi:MAG: mannonate dehydratase [Aliishimia sp.]